MEIWGNFNGIVKNKATLARIGNALITSNKGPYTYSYSIPGDVNDGKYNLPHPPSSADIVLTCSAPGYYPAHTAALSLADGQSLRVNFNLRPL
jgi:hypothetical protein